MPAGPDITFTFPEKLWFSGADYTAESFAFDAGDGQGFRQVKAGDELSVQYTVPGAQTIQFRWLQRVNDNYDKKNIYKKSNKKFA